jgi:hypothetical protein
VLDLIGVRPTVGTKVNNESLVDVLAADLLVDLRRRRRGPRPDLNKEGIRLRIVEIPSWSKPPVPEHVQQGLAVIQGDHMQPPAAAQDEAPMSHPAIGLPLSPERRSQYAHHILIADAGAPGSAATRFIVSRTPERWWR